MTLASPIVERLLFLSCNLGALVAAWSLARLLIVGGTWSIRALATILGFPVIVISTTMALGIAGQLTASAAVVAVSVEAAVLTVLALRRPRPEAAKVFIGSELESVFTAATVGVVLVPAAVILGRHLLHASHFQWDDFTYHATKAAHWLQAERLILAPYTYQSYYPGNAELFSAWFMLPSHGDAFSACAGVFWMALGAVTIVALCRQINVNHAITALAIGLFLVARPFDFNAESFAAVDLAGGVLVAAALAMALPVISSREPRSAIGPVFYCACALGLASGCKFTFFPVLLLVFAWLLLAHRGWGIATLAKGAGLFGACAFVCGGYWYVRNWVVADNPVFPANFWPFEGPLDHETREQTSLLYRLSILEGKELMASFRKLGNWPWQIAGLIVAGYCASVASLVWPRAWRDPIKYRLMIISLVGLFFLAIVTAGPFSGSTNDRPDTLHVRLRYFIGFAVLGIPLVGYWLNRANRARPLLLILGLFLVAGLSKASPVYSVAAGVLGAVVGWAVFKRRPVIPLRYWRPTAAASCIFLLIATHFAMVHKQPKNDRWLSGQTRAWNILDILPVGARTAWHSTFEQNKYYRAFGRGLRIVPIKTREDGAVYQPLHQEWRSVGRKWRQPWKRAYRMDRYIENLLAQRIDYVFLMKRHKGPWPRQYEILRASAKALQVVDESNYAVFEMTRSEEQDYLGLQTRPALQFINQYRGLQRRLFDLAPKLALFFAE